MIAAKAIPTAAAMKQELDHLDSVAITHRDQRLRAPQPWKSGKRRLWAIIIGIEVLVVLALIYFLHHRR